MVYIESKNVGLQPLIDCWIRSLPKVSQYFHKSIFVEIFLAFILFNILEKFENEKKFIYFNRQYYFIKILCNNFESVFINNIFFFLNKYSKFSNFT